MEMKGYVGTIEFENFDEAKHFCDLNKLSQTLAHHSPLKLKRLEKMTKVTMPCDTIAVIDDALVMSKIPVYFKEMLGDEDGSGFDLNKNERDLFFVNGRVSYVLETDSIKIEFN
jgi:uncharacterized linocin/CFP29 family protein